MSKSSRLSGVGVLALVVLLCAPVWAGTLKVFFLDAGEGDAVYIETPGGRRVLVDSGNLVTGRRIAEFLRSRGAGALDAVIITHPHADHMGGVFHILPQVRVDRLYDNGQSIMDSDGDVCRWYGEFFRKENYRALRRGDTLRFGSVSIRVLSPAKLSDNWNNNSLVLRVDFGKTSFLLMADAGIEVERMLVEQSETGLRGVNVLKVGHHGAADASSAEFLEAVSPVYAVVSVDRDNFRGYPSSVVLKRLETKGVRVFVTWRDGDVVFESDGFDVRKSGRVEAGRRVLDTPADPADPVRKRNY